MWSSIRPDLFEHIDGLKSQWKPRARKTDADAVSDATPIPAEVHIEIDESR